MNLALLHVYPLDERMWAGQLDALAGHDVVTPNLYGLGRSMDEWASGVLAQVDGPFAVVGASMGGYCALAIARLAVDRLRALVLVGSPAAADPPERRVVRDETIVRIREHGVETIWNDLRPRLLPENASPEVVEEARRLALDQQPESLVAATEAIRDRQDSRELLRALPVPLLVLVGTRDPFLPLDDAKAMVESAPDGRLVVFEGGGHLPSLERPAEFNRELTTFLAALG